MSHTGTRYWIGVRGRVASPGPTLLLKKKKFEKKSRSLGRLEPIQWGDGGSLIGANQCQFIVLSNVNWNVISNNHFYWSICTAN